MGIRACCVKRDFEEERNLQKMRSNIEYDDTTKEDFAKIENGGYFTEKTDTKFYVENNTNNNIITKNNINIIINEKDDLINEKKAKIIQKNYRSYINKKTFKKNVKPKLIEEQKQLINKLYEECKKYGELASSDDFDIEGWKKYYQPNERFFLYQKGKVFPNQIRIYNINKKNNLEIYEGDINMNNLRHGFGILTTPNYELKGSWRKNNFTGWGRKTMRNGEMMEGKFIQGKLNGKGIYKNSNSIYEGEFLDSQKNGKGELKTQKYIYKGNFINDQFNGKGSIEFFEEGSKYIGDFIKNEICGKGKFEWNNGDIYEGDMKKGKMDGFGKFIFNDGKIYEGEYKNGIKQGKGKLIYPGNIIYDGYFDKGLPEGEGIYIENGKKFKVLFSQGKFIRYLEENNTNDKLVETL